MAGGSSTGTGTSWHGWTGFELVLLFTVINVCSFNLTHSLIIPTESYPLLFGYLRRTRRSTAKAASRCFYFILFYFAVLLFSIF